MKHGVRIGLLVLLTALVAVGAVFVRQSLDGPTVAAAEESSDAVHAPRPQVVDREAAVHLAARYLVTNGDTRGRFLYKVNLDPAVAVADDYNVLRHAGSVYALATYEERFPNERTRGRLRHACSFLVRECIRTVPDSDDLRAVWSTPENSSVDEPQCKLGGTGLGLVALLSVERVAPDTTPRETLRSLGRFLLFMQKSDGAFHSKYLPREGGRWDAWESLYYPGEAALGLVMLDEYDPDPRWHGAAVAALEYLARKRHGAELVEADHWALLATARLFREPERMPADVRERLLDHARQICDSILAERYDWPVETPTHGCFTSDGRTCPTATRLEGLLAALEFLPPEDAERRARVREACDAGVHFLGRSQITVSLLAGAIPRAVLRLAPGHPLYTPAFNRRSTEIRVDYVQHALSALMAHAALEETNR